ncbi:glycosyltransferase family 4 protein [Allocoleopsis sp.]|uniref:glycosyltransferase family 4 protein n=1 Tax=Allocoleopsis sp. TaxID=3088169 RepID=UPI002FD1B717
MLGPSLEEKGGMGSVESLILDSSPVELQIQHLTTWDGEPSRQSSLHRLKVFTWALIIFLGKLLQRQVDVIHIHFSERGSALRMSILTLIAMAFRKPVITHAHGCEFHTFHDELPQGMKQVLNWILQRCTYLIALSESWKDFYINNCDLTAEQVVVLPNPVEIPENVPERSNSHKKINIVFLGRIGKRKGVFDLLEAYAKVAPEQRKKSELILAGIGQVEQANHLAERLYLKEHVAFAGWVDSAKRSELLSQADVFLLPSYNEGLPMALLEAMSWGLPVITTPVGGIPEVITHNETGLLVNPGDVQQLAEALQSLIENESLRLELGSAARQRVAPLDVKIYSRSLSELYFSSLGTNQTRNFEPTLTGAVTNSRCQ